MKDPASFGEKKCWMIRWAKTFYKKTAQQILQFLERKHNLAHEELLEPEIQQSKEILEIIKRYYKGKLELGS